MNRSRTRFQLLSALLIVAGLAPATNALAAQSCRPVYGHFETRQILPDPDPSELEFTGPLIGGIQGSFLSTELVLFPSRPNAPNTFLFTEQLDVTTRQGDFIRTIGTGSFDVVIGSFIEIATTIERNGVFGDFGELFLFGSFDFSVNLGVGDYQGTLCE